MEMPKNLGNQNLTLNNFSKVDTEIIGVPQSTLLEQSDDEQSADEVEINNQVPEIVFCGRITRSKTKLQKEENMVPSGPESTEPIKKKAKETVARSKSAEPATQEDKFTDVFYIIKAEVKQKVAAIAIGNRIDKLAKKYRLHQKLNTQI